PHRRRRPCRPDKWTPGGKCRVGSARAATSACIRGAPRAWVERRCVPAARLESPQFLAHSRFQPLSWNLLLSHGNLAYNHAGDCSGAQTERRGGAGPVRGLLGGKDLTGRFRLFRRTVLQTVLELTSAAGDRRRFAEPSYV